MTIKELYLIAKRDKQLAVSRAKTAEKNLAVMQSRLDNVLTALKDAVSVFSGEGHLVNEERLEAWKNVIETSGRNK
jgi:hypothetical protein